MFRQEIYFVEVQSCENGTWGTSGFAYTSFSLAEEHAIGVCAPFPAWKYRISTMTLIRGKYA